MIDKVVVIRNHELRISDEEAEIAHHEIEGLGQRDEQFEQPFSDRDMTPAIQILWVMVGKLVKENKHLRRCLSHLLECDN